MGNCNCKHGSNGTATACPECDILQMARNNYFTGKLLVERDFTDEQRYAMGKLRRHNQHLHGWGVACGLRVEEHPNSACQAQYVVVEPGTAIDCCGREILLQCEEYFDFASTFLAKWQKQHGPNSQPDDTEHTLQICVSYRECPTEQVPAVFDDCSAGAGSCQPNRILEGHSLDVILDPTDSDPDPHGVSLEWEFTKNIANAVRVAEDEDSKRLYVLTSATSGGTSNAALYVIDTQHWALMASATFANSAGLDVAVDSSGSYIYVVVQPTTAGAAPQLNAYAAAGDFTTTINQVSVGNQTDATMRLLPYPGTQGSVLAYGQNAGFVAMAGLDAAGPSQVGTTTLLPVSAVLSESTAYGYVATNATNNIAVVQIAGEVVAPTPITIALPAQPSSLAIRSTKDGETLAALAGGTLYFAAIPSAGPASATVLTQTVTTFAYPPMRVLLSPGGRWAYVLEKDGTGNAYVQAVDQHAVANNEAAVLGPAVAVGVGPQSEALAQNGRHLYVAGINTAQPNFGGVAIVEIQQSDCSDIFKCLIDGCPDCAQGNCVVLATITGYVYQKPVTKSMIHNLRGRRLLPSTDLIAKAVQCLIESTPDTGPAGPQGLAGTPGANGATWYEGSGVPPAATGNVNDFYLNLAAGTGDGDVYQKQAGGWVKVGNIEGPPGTNGEGITEVSPTFVPCSVPGAASLTPNPTGLTLNLTIPGCCNKSLVTIKSVSWGGNGQSLSAGELQDPGLKIAFSGDVESKDLTANSIAVLIPVQNGTLTSWQEATLKLIPGNFATQGKASSTFTSNTVATNVDGVQISVVDTSQSAKLPSFASVRVIVKGDFIRDATAEHYAVDADHLPPWLPAAASTGDGIEGGTFESWITIKR
jgi:hypothetical protein